MSMRILTTAVALPLLLFIVWLGGLWFSALIAITAGLCAWELCRLARRWGQEPAMPIAVILAAVLAVSYNVIPVPTYPENMELTALFPALLAFLAAVTLPLTHRLIGVTGRTLATFCIALVIGGTLLHAPLLRDFNLFSDDEGRSWIIFLLGTTFVGDTAAFFGGRAIDSLRFRPARTWERVAGGVLGAVVCGTFLASALDLAIPLPAVVLGSVILGITGQLGAMFASKLRRMAAVERSGGLLPGFGGVFDRMGSLMWSLVILYHLVAFSSGSTA